MLNLVEKFTPEAVEATDEDGVVAIEYVISAAAARRGARRRWSRDHFARAGHTPRRRHQHGDQLAKLDPTKGEGNLPLRLP